jgi:pimeloyl-ACP methyl ester carboxylesterase
MLKKTKENGLPRVNLRRMYVDCRYGQLHLRSAFPSNGGFDELTTLICLGPGPATSRLFVGFLGCMGPDRSVYAPDLPGFGESDPPPAKPSAADHAAAIVDFIDHMRFRRVDLLGYEGGASIATALAAARPQKVSRVVLVAPPAQELPGDARALQQPVLVLRPADAPWEVGPGMKAALAGAKIAELPKPSVGLIDQAPEVVALHARSFLD